MITLSSDGCSTMNWVVYLENRGHSVQFSCSGVIFISISSRADVAILQIFDVDNNFILRTLLAMFLPCVRARLGACCMFG